MINFYRHTTDILCCSAEKQEIKEFLSNRLKDLMELIAADESEWCISETDDAVCVNLPCGDIARNGAVYVDAVPRVFAELKKAFPTLGISGVIYEFDKEASATYGPVFFCEPSDSELTVSYDWQMCAHCGKIVLGDAFYNSSQRDFGEGNLYCLCSPTCMLEYSLGNGSWEEVGANASLSDEERQEIDDNREIDVLSAILWERIEDLLDEDEFIEDFAEHRERIQELLELNYLDENKEAVLRRILSEIE